MRVIHLARRYHPYIGGVETHLQHLIKVMAKDGHTSIVITQQFSSSDPLQDIIDGTKILRIPLQHSEQKIGTWRSIINWWQVFSKADVIQIHDVFWWFLPCILFFRKKTFMTFHGYEGNSAPDKKQQLWHQLASRLTQGNLAIGGFHEKWYGIKPTLTSYGAGSTLKEKDPKKQKNNIIFIGRLEDDNGIKEYLEAIKLLQEKGKTYHLDVFGEGSLEKECKKYIADNNLSVAMHGFKANAARQLPNYSIAFVSRYLAIIEALQVGCAVIAQYNNEIKYDYLIKTPFCQWIAVEQEGQNIADAVIEIKPLRKEAKTWARAQTWKKMAENYYKLWKKN